MEQVIFLRGKHVITLNCGHRLWFMTMREIAQTSLSVMFQKWTLDLACSEEKVTRKVQSRYCGKTWNAHQWYRLRQRQHNEPFIRGQREAGTYQVRKVIFNIQIVPLKNIDRLESIICFSTFWIKKSQQVIVLRGWTNHRSQFLRDRAKLEPRDLGTSSDFFRLNSWDFLLGSRFWKIRSLALPQNDKNPSLHFTRCIPSSKNREMICWSHD